MSTELTPMEGAIIKLVADLHWPGFRVDQLEVSRREHTGVGPYTHIADRGEQAIADGSYGADAHFIEMEGVPNGLFFVVEVDKSRIAYVEIVSAGTDAWDGVERSWRMV